VNEGDKTYGPNIAFFSATLTTFLSYKKKKVKITSNEFNYEGNVLTLCLANAKYFGSGLGIAPTANVSDGKISLTLAGDVSLTDYLKNVFKIRKCKQLNHPRINYSEVESCSIEPIGTPCLIEADGELIGKLPAKAKMIHHAINFLTRIEG
jgi:diacylglycerol kinase (ATP)